MKHQQYNNPPLLELTCEINFKSDQSWDVFYFKDFYTKIKERFPHRVMIEETITLSDDSGLKDSFTENRSSMECVNEEKNLILVFKENFFSLRVVPPYKGWSDFKEHIIYVLNAYTEITQPILIHKPLLKYRNKVNVGSEHSYENLCKVFTTKPNLVSSISDKYRLNALQMLLEFYSEDKKSILFLQQHSLQAEIEKSAPVLFDLGYLCIDATELLKEKNFESWLEAANDSIHYAFQHSLTKSIKQTFN